MAKVSNSNKAKINLPIAWRLSMHVAGIGSLLCITVVLSLLPFQYGRVELEAITEARILAEAVSTIYQNIGPLQSRDHARRLLLRVARTPHISLVNVQDKTGVVKFSTDSRELGKIYPTRYGIKRKERVIKITHVLSNQKSDVGSVTVVIDRDLMLVGTHRLFAQVGIGLLVMIFVLSFLVKGLAEKLISARLARLMHLIENAEKGSFLVRAQVDRNDEIGHVILGFNQLLGVITQIEAGYLEKEHSLKDAQAQKNIRLELEKTLDKLKRSNESLEKKVQAQDLLMDAAHSLGGTLEKESVVERLKALLIGKLTWPHFALYLMGSQKNEENFLTLVAESSNERFDVDLKEKVAVGEGISGTVAQTGAPILIRNLENEKQLRVKEVVESHGVSNFDSNKIGSIMSVPLLNKGRVVGVFTFFNSSNNAFDADDVALMSALGALASLAIVNAELYETTLELATSDPLTGVLNRRAMVRQIEYELARAQRFETKVALLLVDVDHFKGYNDRMGHVLGDVALKEIAKSLGEKIRKVDTLARFGGEEFCVILPQADVKAAKEVAQKLCDGVRGLKLRGAEKQELGHLSVSIGIAIAPDDMADLDSKNAMTDLISIADRALYDAKRLGRDRFVHLVS